jgi:hypothetical protein
MRSLSTLNFWSDFDCTVLLFLDEPAERWVLADSAVIPSALFWVGSVIIVNLKNSVPSNVSVALSRPSGIWNKHLPWMFPVLGDPPSHAIPRFFVQL